jgi:uncharacterized membrane protein
MRLMKTPQNKVYIHYTESYRKFPVTPDDFVWVSGPLGRHGALRSLDAYDVRDVVTDIDRLVHLQHRQSNLIVEDGMLWYVMR